MCRCIGEFFERTYGSIWLIGCVCSYHVDNTKARWGSPPPALFSARCSRRRDCSVSSVGLSIHLCRLLGDTTGDAKTNFLKLCHRLPLWCSSPWISLDPAKKNLTGRPSTLAPIVASDGGSRTKNTDRGRQEMKAVARYEPCCTFLTVAMECLVVLPPRRQRSWRSHCRAETFYNALFYLSHCDVSQRLSPRASGPRTIRNCRATASFFQECWPSGKTCWAGERAFVPSVCSDTPISAAERISILLRFKGIHLEGGYLSSHNLPARTASFHFQPNELRLLAQAGWQL